MNHLAVLLTRMSSDASRSGGGAGRPRAGGLGQVRRQVAKPGEFGRVKQHAHLRCRAPRSLAWSAARCRIEEMSPTTSLGSAWCCWLDAMRKRALVSPLRKSSTVRPAPVAACGVSMARDQGAGRHVDGAAIARVEFTDPLSCRTGGSAPAPRKAETGRFTSCPSSQLRTRIIEALVTAAASRSGARSRAASPRQYEVISESPSRVAFVLERGHPDLQICQLPGAAWHPRPS
jgi:hypothetical protein